MAVQKALAHLSPKEYLSMEEQSDIRHEYCRGELFAMAGASINHNRIVRNVLAAFTSGLAGKPCEPFSGDLRLWIESAGLFTYPDVSVICGEPEFHDDRDDTITNPVLLVEVLSKSTKDYDRGEKFLFYRTLPSLREYLLIDQYGCHVERFLLNRQRQWVLDEWGDMNHVVELVSIGLSISLPVIYNGVS